MSNDPYWMDYLPEDAKVDARNALQIPAREEVSGETKPVAWMRMSYKDGHRTNMVPPVSIDKRYADDIALAPIAAMNPRNAEPTGEEVERVARAISEHTFAIIDPTDGSDCQEWEEMSETARNTYIKAARAALSAIREGE